MHSVAERLPFKTVQTKDKPMLSAKTKKAFCLSLLMTLTAPVSAEGWYETLKSWITPKTVLTTTGALLVGALAYREFQRRQFVPIQQLTFGNETVDIQHERLTAKNAIVNNGNVNAQVVIDAGGCSGHVLSIETPTTRSQLICRFTAYYKTSVTLHHDVHTSFFIPHENLLSYNYNSGLQGFLYRQCNEENLAQRHTLQNRH